MLQNNVENLLVFYYLSQTGSVDETCKFLDVSRVTVYRKIKDLEILLGNQKLFFNNRKGGVALSPFGEKVLDEVAFMKNSLDKSLENVLSLKDKVKIKKTIRVVTTTGMLSLIVVRAIDAYVMENPDINFIINTTGEEFDSTKFTYDIAYFPEADLSKKNYKVENTGLIESSFFASKKYIETYGKPKTFDDLENHKIIQFHIHDKFYRGTSDWLYEEDIVKSSPVLKVNSLLARIYALKIGLGIANIPTNVNKELELNLIKINDIPSKSSDNLGIILKTKYQQDYLKSFFDFSIENMKGYLK